MEVARSRMGSWYYTGFFKFIHLIFLSHNYSYSPLSFLVLSIARVEALLSELRSGTSRVMQEVCELDKEDWETKIKGDKAQET